MHGTRKVKLLECGISFYPCEIECLWFAIYGIKFNRHSELATKDFNLFYASSNWHKQSPGGG